LTKEKVDQLIEDCKTIQYYYTINNMSQKILLDKINIPGIKPTKYTVKTGLCFSRKALKTLTPDEVVEEVKTSGLWSWWSRFPQQE
jgi:NADH:ubiquinone oxidoreductase subunit F (NADH-binding)